jgi:hypothetical protein
MFRVSFRFLQPGDTATNLLMKNTDTEAAAKMGVSIGEVVGGGEVGPSCLDPKVKKMDENSNTPQPSIPLLTSF